MHGKDWRHLSHPGGGPRAASFARRVLERVNHMPAQVRATRLESFAMWLSTYVTNTSYYDQQEVLYEAERLRMARDDVILHCVPRTAAILGQHWASNELGFAEVSLGSARLHGLVRGAAEQWDVHNPLETGLSFMLCTVDSEDHLIGCSVLIYQLRLAGHSVCSLVKAKPREIVEKLDVGCYDSLLFSCATIQTLETVARAVKHIRTAACVQPVIALGGPVLHEVDSIKDKTGVDLVTNDINTVVAHVTRGMSHSMREVAE